ncbi:flagellar FliL protein [Amphibacillus marinus]|uniref:Flagellar FliL protein n=1 Tax=Amphibacillus marinus TaxID=872970 RepID=A0A1H8HRD9_9BACI|nr:flagellar basal body-associated protein FliL [Amphibacillus marinus]SEN58617.1 flagellar FliL protein [Amphibacillus marinus]
MTNKAFKVVLTCLIMITIIGLALVIFLLLNNNNADNDVITIDDQIEASYMTEAMNIDLSDNRYAQLQFRIITDSVDTRDEMEKRIFQFQNLLIKETVDMNSEELNSDLSAFETRLKDEMNVFMEDGEITDIFIVSKIIQ